MRHLRDLQDVVDWDLCIGCGICDYLCDRDAVEMVDVLDLGIRPKLDQSECQGCGKCLPICPGANLDADLATGGRPRETQADHEFGPVLEIWEGFASDPEVRFKASSGGAITALSSYCLEHEGMAFTLHSAMDEQTPWRNETQISRNAEELKRRAGSRYAPSSPCQGLEQIKTAKGRAIFVGKPCDVAAVQAARARDPELDAKLGLVLTFFCAGTPSSRGTLDLLDGLGVEPDRLRALRYRGEGWPGRFRPELEERSDCESLSYAEAWGQLTAYRSLRCHLCPDGLGRVADLSCGDAWHRYAGGSEGEGKTDDEDMGRSLILVNTEHGREILHRAIKAGYLTLERVGAAEVIAAQGLLDRRRQLWGRLLALRLLRPVPNFVGFSLWQGWKQLSWMDRFRSVAGTLRRALRKGWWQRRQIDWEQ